MPSLRRRVLVASAAVLAAAAVAAPAQAHAENVLDAISSQSKIILNSQAEKTAHHLKSGTLAQERKAIPVYESLAREFDHAASVAAAATASTARQRTGQREWVSGMHDFATAYRNLALAFGDLSRHDSAGAEAILGKTHKVLSTAVADTDKAYKLFGISSGGL
jgi:hypothetical protein